MPSRGPILSDDLLQRCAKRAPQHDRENRFCRDDFEELQEAGSLLMPVLAWRVVDRALDLSGGVGMLNKSELERLFRDARAGRFHPANSMLTHELVPGRQPRRPAAPGLASSGHLRIERPLGAKPACEFGPLPR